MKRTQNDNWAANLRGPKAFHARGTHLNVTRRACGSDEGAGDASEGEEVVGFAFVASVEAAAAGEPGHGAFYAPTVTAQSLRGLHCLAGDPVRDAPLT